LAFSVPILCPLRAQLGLTRGRALEICLYL
jgi:hypothetical protein